MQLSVAYRQQPMRGFDACRMQLVVASLKDMARKAFADLLNAELDRVGVPQDRARIGWVHKSVKHKGKPLVSREQVRKWIRGKDIPDQTNLRIVCEQLGLDWARLQTGTVPTPMSAADAEIQAAIAALDEAKKYAVLQYVRFIKDDDAKADARAAARPEGDDSEGDRASLQRHRRA
jgi:hypothetical protein